jgi:hypothetical protein
VFILLRRYYYILVDGCGDVGVGLELWGHSLDLWRGFGGIFSFIFSTMLVSMLPMYILTPRAEREREIYNEIACLLEEECWVHVVYSLSSPHF